MKPQKKAVVALKAQKTPSTIAKKRRPSPEKIPTDTKKLDKKLIKKPDRPEDLKKKVDSEKKKLEQLEKRRKYEQNRKKAEEKKKEKMEKAEDNKKKLSKDSEKKSDVTEEKKVEKNTEKIEETSNDIGPMGTENNKKKNQKLEEKSKTEKINFENKKKNEKIEEKKKVGKPDEIQEDSQKCNNIGSDENSVIEDKAEISVAGKKKGKEDKKKEGKTIKTECKENSKSPTTKEKKVAEAKKSPDKETVKKVAGTTTPTTPTTSPAPTITTVTTTTTTNIMKKESKARQQPQKKATTKKTVLAKKTHSPLAKKFIEKKLKLVKIQRGEEDNNETPEEGENTLVDAATATVSTAKSKKKNPIIPKAKTSAQEKKPKLAKQMKVKLPQKNVKINNALKKDKIKKITEKIVANKKKIETKENPEKPVSDASKKTTGKEEPLDNLETDQIKREICDEKDEEKSKEETPPVKSPDNKKAPKSAVKPKIIKKPVKKTTKVTKSQSDESDQVSTKSEDVSLEDLMKQSAKNYEESINTAAIAKKELAESMIKIDLKVEEVNGEESKADALSGEASPTSASDSEDNYEDEIESRGRGKQRNVDRRGGKERESSPSDERARRMRLFGFWSGPKRHRVASLNALAKVHCLYENEAGGVYLGGFCKPKPEKEKPKKQPAVTAAKDETKDEAPVKKPKETKKPADATKVEDNNKRNLRNVPGLRGKHWDMAESSSSSSSSSSDEDGEREKAATRAKKRSTTRRKKPEEVMDLKDMVVCKRMASLNASAILAASYSDEKNRHGSSASDSSSESEVEVIKKRKQGDSEIENKRKSAGRQVSGDPGEEVIKPSKKVVIVNQDTDVTITGVYVNQTRSTHHEGFCSIAGMQYRISSTSHTQTAATAVAAELHEQKPEQPCKSYTPLGALSSMQPPGSQGSHPNMSPRRHSAFSAPHQHGYYQPAGPLIQHPPTLPPVKAPPPEPTPTPPQNSEGSDDLVATSTTSGGTNSTGNSWRSLGKSESVTNAAGPSTAVMPSGGGFYRAYCPQYYGTPPQYQELCYPPTYSHPHSHPPYYKYAPTYRRQYYGYPGADGGGGTGGAGAGTPGVVEYQAPPPGEYPMPPYYGGYPPPPPPPPPPPNPAYLHAQGRPIVDHAAFQGCPCPMQSCPKNVDTGPLIGNGKGAPVASGPGLSLPPSALVGPPSPARGLAGLAPPHGANAWDTDRVQLNTHRSNLNSQGQQQQIPPTSAVHSIVVGGHSRAKNTECRTKDENTCTKDKLGKCNCQKHACTSTCEVKLEALSPTETLSSSTSCQSEKTIHDFKLENNNVKCESCSVGVVVGQENISCSANCNVKCESGYKCEIMKCEQCMKEGQMAILELDKDSGILLIDEKRLEADSGVKEELNDVVVVDTQNWQKPDYEPIVQEVVDETENVVSDDNPAAVIEEMPKCQKLTKRKLSLDSLSDSIKKRKVDKRTLSVGSTRDCPEEDRLSPEILVSVDTPDAAVVEGASKKPAKKESQSQKRKAEGDGSTCESPAPKKPKNSKTSTSNGTTSNGFKTTATESSINETIDDVIQQSLLMSRKKERKCELPEKSVDSKKKKGANLLSTIKKVTKKIDLVKAAVAEKLCLTKTEAKTVKDATTNKCKVETKLKTNKTQQDAKCKSSKVKAKIAEVKSKVLDSKPKVPDVKTKEVPKKIESVSCTVGVSGCSTTPALPKSRIVEVCENVKRAALVKKKRKSTKKTSSCVKKAAANTCSKPAEDIDSVIENCSLAKRPFLKPKWSNGWEWEGDSYEAKVYLTNEESAIRRCYASMRHSSGDVLRPRDCVLLKSGQRKADLPFVAKIAALWENPDDGEMMFSLLWYYRPEHTEQGRTDYDTEDEVFASRHRDANSVATIEDKCYILTFNEYCRYRKNLRRVEEGLESPGLIVPPGEHPYPRECRQPPIQTPVSSDMVLFCRRVYDYRGKKLIKNPG